MRRADPNANLPDSVTYIGDGKPKAITNRQLVRYHVPHEVTRGGESFLEYEEISYVIGTVRFP